MKYFFPLLLGCALSFVSTSFVLAHEVLPQRYIDFTQTHPNATVDEFNQFLDANPDLKGDGDFLAHVEIVRNPPVGFWHNARDFIKLGIQHILGGTDHILFVLSLLLIYSTLKREIILLSVFTVAHSISLIFAGSGALVLSSKIVEPVVALSITYMAITTVFFKEKRVFGDELNKIATVFIFGLFHGLGFAGLMKDIRVPDEYFISSLFSFNIGIELGQILIVVVILPFIFFFRSKNWYPIAIKVVATIIATIGLVWGVERIIG